MRRRGMIWPAQDCPPKLGFDEACLNVFAKVDYPLQLYAQVDECHRAACDELLWKVIPPQGNVSLLVNSAHELFIIYKDKSNLYRCGASYRFAEHGMYTYNVTGGHCHPIEPKPGEDWNYWMPLLMATIMIILTSVVWMGAKQLYKTYWMAASQSPHISFINVMKDDLNIQPESRGASTVTVASSRRQGSRIFSLDVFRGICIAMMIFVNYGGGEYKIFKHAAWDGLTFADVVFPWFLWIMGVSLVLSLRSQFRNDRSRTTVWLLVVRRSVILIALGLILNSVGHGNNALALYRIPGVLQRIGLAHFIIASIETCFVNPGGPYQARICEDISYGRVQNLFAFFLAFLWLFLTFRVDVPNNCGRGYLGPGGMDKRGRFQNCTGGAAGYIDRLILTPNHIYQHPTCEKIFQTTQPYDPEGLLGTLNAAFLVHLGTQAGRILFCYSSTRERIIRWLFWGILLCFVAGKLCDFQIGNEGPIPINKNLFSLSYVLLTGGLAFIALALLYVVVDHANYWDGAPFIYAGMNAISLYVGHEVVREMFPWSWKPIWNTHVELLAMNLWGTSLWLLTAYALWRKNIFLTV